MDEIARALAAHPPFDQLPLALLEQLAATMQIEYFAAGTDVLTHNGPPAIFLYIIQRGSVDLLREDAQGLHVFDTLGMGETFGSTSLIRQRPPIVTVRTREETLAYLLPAAVFQQLRRDQPAFGQFFAATAIERLNFALHARQPETAPALFHTRLEHLARQPAASIGPQASVGEAARTMRDQQISSLIVTSVPPGIITDRDLRNRVLAAGLSDSTPVAQVMTAPVHSLPATALVFEGLLAMLEHGIHHLPLTAAGQIVGMVTHTDLMRQQSNSPLFLPRLLQRATSPAELQHYANHVADTIGTLLDAGARSGDVGRVVALAHDALLVRLLRDAEARLGPPPCAYAWLVLGSEGRYEQTFRTDQDNGLIYADDGPPESEAYFAALAEQVVGQLVACGFPRCPGNIMATNPQWRQPLRVWQHYFQTWISTPDEEALLRAAIFFDFRPVHGTLDVEAALRPIIRHGRDERVFLGRLARTALRQPAPLNFFHQIVAEGQGQQRNLVDLKLRGTALIVDLARLFALEAGSSETSTLARLRAAANQSSLDQSGAEELSAAFELISLLRLRYQRQQRTRQQPISNKVPLSALSAHERQELKEALQAIGRVQRGIQFTFQTGRMA
jgi:CBS domain-containing protein